MLADGLNVRSEKGTRRMRFRDLNWMDIESYLGSDDRVILVLGACEQHGYLSLCTDTLIPEAVADAAAKRAGVLVAPGLPYGVSPFFAGYPGTVSIRVRTFSRLLEDLIRDLYRQGFRGILVLNGHGGNDPGSLVLSELANELPELRAAWISWWRTPRVSEVARRHDLEVTHASWFEAFPFTRVTELPEGQSEKPEQDFRVASAGFLRSRSTDGVLGGPYQASESVQQELLDAAVADVMETLDVLHKSSQAKKEPDG